MCMTKFYEIFGIHVGLSHYMTLCVLCALDNGKRSNTIKKRSNQKGVIFNVILCGVIKGWWGVHDGYGMIKASHQERKVWNYCSQGNYIVGDI